MTTFRQFVEGEEAFSVVELLVVMTVIALLTGIAWSGFRGLRTSMSLYQSSQAARADIVFAQRAAMLLERVPNETWIQGVGIDLRKYVGSPGDNQKYTLFKLCSDLYNYEDYNSDDLTSAVSGLKAFDSECGITSSWAALFGKKDVEIQGQRLGTCTTNANPSAVDRMTGRISFIIFEAVNGRIHLYGRDGTELMETSDLTGVRITYYLGERYNSVSIKFSGEIVYEGYDPLVTNPCN